MKITHIVRQFSPVVGGLENYILDLAIEQVKQGHEVKVVTLNRAFGSNELLPQTEDICGITVVRIAYRGSSKYPFAFSVLKHLKDADIVNVHAVDFFCDFIAFTKLIHRKPIILTTHGGFFHTQYASRLKTVFFNLVTRFSMLFYSKVIACSIGDFNTFAKITHKDKLVLIENGINTNKFSHPTTVMTKLNNKKLIYIGRFSDNKRIDQLIHYFNAMYQLDNQYRLSICGRDADNNLVDIEQLIVDLKRQDAITLMVNPSDAELQAECHSSDFIVSASSYEGFGMSILEGMSAKLIPLISNIPSFEYIVKQSQCGLLVDFDDLNSAPHLLDSIANINDIEEHKNQCKVFSLKYSWTHKQQEYQDIMDTVLGRESRTILGNTLQVKRSDQIFGDINQTIENNRHMKMAFANANLLNMAYEDQALKQELSDFYIVNDGIGVDIASSLKYGTKFPENLNGTDLIPRILKNTKSGNVFLYGAEEASVSKCYQRLKKENPHLNFAGYVNGYDEETAEVLLKEYLHSNTIDILIVALGNPIQEKWIAEFCSENNVRVAIGVGAFFDFYSGNVSRAPKLVRKLRSEWLYRLFLEPKRMWKRYLVGNVLFLKRIVLG
jgi:alpha-1,3-mannosyltransferase